MGLVTLIAAAEESSHSETPFYVVGIALAVFAVLISVVGFTRPDFPGSEAVARAVMSVGAVLVVLTGGMIVYVAS
jgi:hypothetical protein